MAELTLQVLQDLCKSENDLLNDVTKLRTFNIFLARTDLGLPFPIEFAIGCLLNSPLVVHKKISLDIAKELDLTRKLCSNLMRCRTKLFADRLKVDLEQEKNALPSMRTSTIFNRPVFDSKNDGQLTEKEQSALVTVSENTTITVKPTKLNIVSQPTTPPIVITLDDTVDMVDAVEDDYETIILSDDEDKTHKFVASKSPKADKKRKSAASKIQPITAPSKRQRRNSQIDYSKILAADPKLNSTGDSHIDLTNAEDDLNKRIAAHSSKGSTDFDDTNKSSVKTRRSKRLLMNEKIDNLADLF